MLMNYLNLYIYMIFYVSVGLTVMYSFRLVYYLMICSFNSLSLNNLSEEMFTMLKGMSGLIIMVIFSGSSILWLMFPSMYFICLSKLMKLLA